jgi:hypothetical protein
MTSSPKFLDDSLLVDSCPERIFQSTVSKVCNCRSCSLYNVILIFNKLLVDCELQYRSKAEHETEISDTFILLLVYRVQLKRDLPLKSVKEDYHHGTSYILGNGASSYISS